MEKVVKGKRHVVNQVLICFLSQGHILIDDSPGLGKTMLAKSLARSIDSEFSRIQFTPDLLPSDLLGVSVWKPSEGEFEFHHGPIFANLVLADEINRTSPKTQSALLEAMAEAQITIDKKTYSLPKPFMVIATQNPIEAHGTYPLLESQLDRFLSVVDMGYPDATSEVEMLSTHQQDNQLETLKSVVDLDSIITAMKSTAEVFVAEPIRQYLVDIANATRNHPNISQGISPRATLDLQRISQTHACVSGRDFVTPEDIKPLVKSSIAHRIYPVDTEAMTSTQILDEILQTVPTPLITNKT